MKINPGTVLALFTVAGLLGSAYAIFTTRKSASTAQVWKGEAEAQKERADRLETELSQEHTRYDALEKRVEGLEEANKILAQNASGAQAVESLAVELRSWMKTYNPKIDSIAMKVGAA